MALNQIGSDQTFVNKEMRIEIEIDWDRTEKNRKIDIDSCRIFSSLVSKKKTEDTTRWRIIFLPQ